MFSLTREIILKRKNSAPLRLCVSAVIFFQERTTTRNPKQQTHNLFKEEEILKALSTVEDPDLKQDLVSLGMISAIKVDGNKISFTVTLTTPACPLKELIRKNCIDAIHG